ncbi:hypothetical protein ACIOWG_18230 [Streptomyces sp. NPDC087658]|uniref:COG1470 family protein n=1 Tax=Streptomyces sp. NPDC087658 TaxID=3365800 RepID=UPI0037F67A08
MSIWTSLEPASTTVDPGSSTTVRLRLRNTGDVVEEYRFVPVGAISPYIGVEPATVRLYPGTTGTVELTFAPPRTPDATAGPNPYGVQIIPTEHPEATTVVEGNLTITPFVEIRAELVPPTVKGRFRGRPKLAVDNLGNTALIASLSGSDTGDELSYTITPSNIRIEPGQAAFVDATLKPHQITWAGQKQQRPYELTVKRSGAEPLGVEGTYIQRSVLPYWMMTVFSLLLALTITGIVLWLGQKPDVRTLAKPQPAGAVALPQPDVPLPETALPPEAPKQQDPAPQVTSNGDTDTDTEQGQGQGQEQEPEPDSGKGEETEKTEERGPLPFRAGDEPNIFVQFAQVRLAKVSYCRLDDVVSAGRMDAPTVKALACWQKTNDQRINSTLVESDGLGNLGRATMTSLLAAHFNDRTTQPLNTGDKTPELPWVQAIVMWGSNYELDNGDVERMTSLAETNIAYLNLNQIKGTVTEQTAREIGYYQDAVNLPNTGVVDRPTLAAMKLGKVKGQDSPGTVTATAWPPAPKP